MTDPTWSAGILIGLPIAALIVAAITAAAVAAITHDEREVGIVMALAAIAVAAITGGLLWPWDAEYHQWRPRVGIVDQVSNRLVSDGDQGPTQRFAVRFHGQPTEYSCDDTRCALVRPGDWLEITCKRAWQWSGTNGYDCNYLRHW